jgi:hypothetical protein
MSWDKNTFVVSEIDSIIKTLVSVDVPYTVEVIGHVSGVGINDSEFDGGSWTNKKYPIRRLMYKDMVVQEVMERSHDCDFDDYLKSYCFEDEGWETLPLERYYDEES